MPWAILIIFAIGFIYIVLSNNPRSTGSGSYNKKNNARNSNKNSNYKPGMVWDEKLEEWVKPNTSTSEQHTEPKEPEKPEEQDNEKLNYEKSYQAKLLFTKNEWYAHKKLRDIADIKGYIICPKVRLLDIVEPRKGVKKYKTLFYKIQAKHVDFVVCDRDMHIKAIIELDDNSHDTAQRKERDEFVDKILRSVGYKVIHTRYINYDILDLV